MTRVLVVGTEAFWWVILSKHHQKASLKPWCEIYLAPGPEICPCRANPTCQFQANTKRAGFLPLLLEQLVSADLTASQCCSIRIRSPVTESGRMTLPQPVLRGRFWSRRPQRPVQMDKRKGRDDKGGQACGVDTHHRRDRQAHPTSRPGRLYTPESRLPHRL